MSTRTRRRIALAGLGLGALLAGSTAAAPAEVPLAPAGAVLAIASETVRRLPPRRAPRVREPKRLGHFQLTYYWMAHERNHRPATAEPGSPEDVVLVSRSCRPIARVSESFARSLRIEGAGVLRDGRTVTTAGNCRCAGPCYRVPHEAHRFGTGVQDRPLSPFRSVAVDPAHVAIGSRLYVPELDGVQMPGPAPWGGFVHDGCVVADDRGGGVRGKQIDFFTARRDHYKALHERLRLRRVTVMDGTERCATGAVRRIQVAARRVGA